MPEGMFDVPVLLDLAKAYLHADGAVGLNGDQIVALRYKVPQTAVEQCRAWLDENRRTLTNFNIEQRNFPDTYRSVKVETVGIEREDRNSPVLIVQTFAKGYIESLALDGGGIDWTEARWSESGLVQAPGNTTEISGISDTLSDDDAKYLSVEFRNCAPEKGPAICAEFSADTYPNVSVEGEAVPGEYHRIMQSWRKEQDGSITVTIRLAQSQYTLQAFQNLNLPNTEDVYYLWSVPKAIAQEIITNWRTVGTAEQLAGRSASASFDEGSQTVNLTLAARGNPTANLSTDPMVVSCDAVVVHHYAWGYTEAQLETFIANHTTDTNHAGDVSGVDGEPNPLAWSGRTREIRVSARGDGFFDAQIVEFKRTFDAAKHVWSVGLASGSNTAGNAAKIVRTHEWGFHVPMSQLDNIKADYEYDAATDIGYRKTLKINRQDDCTFDYEGEIELENALERTATSTASTPATDGGVITDIRVGTGLADAAALTTFLEQLRPGKRKSVQVSVDLKDNSTIDAKAVRTTVIETAQSTIGDSSRKLLYGANTNAPTLPANHKLVGGSVQPKDDGTFDFALTVKDTDNPVRDAADSGNNGIAVEVAAAVSAAIGDATGESIASSGPRQRVDISLRPDEDGTVAYQVTRQTVQESRVTLATSGGGGVQTEITAEKNRDPSNVASLGTSGPRERVDASLQLADDGTLDAIIKKTTVVQTPSTDIGSGARILRYGANTSAPALAGSEKLVGGSVNPKDDGTFDFAITVKDTNSPVADAATSTGGVITAVSAATGAAVGDLASDSLLQGGPRKSVDISIRPQEDGTVDYSVQQKEVVQTNYSAVSGGTGVGVEVTAIKNVDQVLTLGNAGPRVRIDASLSANDDGTIDGQIRKTTVQETPQATIGTGARILKYGANTTAPTLSAGEKLVGGSVNPKDDGTFDFGLTVKDTNSPVVADATSTGGIVTRVSAATGAPAGTISDALLAGGARKAVEVSLRPQEDGTVEYTIQQREAVQTLYPASTSGTGVGLEVTAHKNVDQILTLGAVGPRVRIDASISANDDGTLDGVVKRTTVQETAQASVGSGARKLIYGSNTTAPVLGTDKLVGGSVNPKDDGTFDFALNVKEAGSPVRDSATSGAAGVTVEAVGAVNADIGDAAAESIATSGQRQRVSIGIRPQEDGTVEYQVQRETVQETRQFAVTGTGPRKILIGSNTIAPVVPVDHAVVGGSVNPKDDGTVDFALTVKDTTTPVRDSATSGASGISVAVDAATGAAVGAASGSTLITSGPRERVDVNLRPQEDGSVDFVVAKQTVQKPEADKSITPVAGLGVGLRVASGKNVDAADITTALTNFIAGARVSHDMRIDGNDDGTFDYVIRENETQANSQSAVGGAVGESVSYLSAEDMDLLPAIPAPAPGDTVTVSMRPNKDGTVSYDVVTAHQNVQTRTASGGNRGLQQSITVTTGDTAVPQAPDAVTGVTTNVSLDINRNGTVDHRVVTITRGALSQSFTSVYDKEKEGWIVGSTETVFSGVASGALPTPSGHMYRWEGISINDDGTFNGTLRTYDISGWISFVAPGSVTYSQEKRLYRDSNAGVAQYRDITYTVVSGTTYNGVSAYNAISGGLENSTVVKMDFWGRDVWYYEKWTIATEGSWTDL